MTLRIANVSLRVDKRHEGLPLNAAEHHRTLVIFVLVAMVFCDYAHAGDSDRSMFSFSGFGTFGAVHSTEADADFTSTIFKPNGAGHSREWSFDVDTLLGVQVSAEFSPEVTAVIQVISEQDEDNSYRPQVEWANIRYQFTPDFSVRLGRVVLPSFLASETRKVGYTFPWVRPPQEVYRILPITHSDGVDLSYRLHVGDLANTVQINVGSNDTQFVDNRGTAEQRGAWGISNTVEYGAWTARMTYQKAHLTLQSLNRLFAAFRQFGAQGNALANKYDSDDTPVIFLAAGASYDPGRWFVTAEWGHSNTHSAIGERTGWYTSGGYRAGPFTPFVTYSEAEADNLSDPGLDLSMVPPALVGRAIGLNAALNSVLRVKTIENTISLGGRWDFARSAALTLQYDHTSIDPGSNGVLSNTQPDFRTGGNFGVFSATIAFVF